MSSAFVCPSQLLDNDRARVPDARNSTLTHIQHQHQQPITPSVDTHRLSPLLSSSSQPLSRSASPTLNQSSTPADSISSVHYQSSDFSEYDDTDPYLGIDFGNADGTPSFLGDVSDFADLTGLADLNDLTSPLTNGHGYHPLSPEQTPSAHTTSPPVARSSSLAPSADLSVDLPPHGELLLQDNGILTTPRSVPDASGGGLSSGEEGLTAAAPPMPSQSPRVTVSMWSRDSNASAQDITGYFEDDLRSPATVQGVEISMDDSFLPSEPPSMVAVGDKQGSWAPATETRRRGLDPSNRPSGEVSSSPNEMAARRRIEKRNYEVGEWLVNAEHAPNSEGSNAAQRPPAVAEGVSDNEIALGDQTENTMRPGGVYFTEGGGRLDETDVEIIHESRWGDAPALLPISLDHHQPETSNEAIQKFERLCQDNDSIVSRAATWGTRRRSLPIIDIEGITNGSFLKKLTIRSGETRRPNILRELRGLVRKPSANQLLKRSRGSPDDDASSGHESGEEKRERPNTLAPPARAMSWGKKQPMPSINTALVSMGSSVASIGTTHARSGSISTTTPVMSPKSPFSLKVGNTLRRPRSKSELPKSAVETSHSNLVDMWKKTGGPPVPSLAKTTPLMDVNDDDDDDEELEDGDTKVEPTKTIEDIVPNFTGFHEHVLKLNPLLATTNTYLADRIAHQQCVRYKFLLQSRLKHINNVQNRNCACGRMCIGLGGTSTVMDCRADGRGTDFISARYETFDGDITPLEGAIGPESFPPDIPMPPTQALPAEFECQLCYQVKRPQKPSDWTKHVHEDVQPFTCTWDRCRDPKIFKRKADWVRHENEGHRHLEWWTCDVDDCRHICYRRDNFLQHLVREHKFPEPQVKTKAAIKKAGGYRFHLAEGGEMPRRNSNTAAGGALPLLQQDLPDMEEADSPSGEAHGTNQSSRHPPRLAKGAGRRHYHQSRPGPAASDVCAPPHQARAGHDEPLAECHAARSRYSGLYQPRAGSGRLRVPSGCFAGAFPAFAFLLQRSSAVGFRPDAGKHGRHAKPRCYGYRRVAHEHGLRQPVAVSAEPAGDVGWRVYGSPQSLYVTGHSDESSWTPRSIWGDVGV